MKELSVVRFKNTVEKGLQDHFGKYGRHADLAGQLSVYPERVGPKIVPKVLDHQCDDFSREFQRWEGQVGLGTKLAVSD